MKDNINIVKLFAKKNMGNHVLSSQLPSDLSTENSQRSRSNQELLR